VQHPLEQHLVLQVDVPPQTVRQPLEVLEQVALGRLGPRGGLEAFGELVDALQEPARGFVLILEQPKGVPDRGGNGDAVGQLQQGREDRALLVPEVARSSAQNCSTSSRTWNSWGQAWPSSRAASSAWVSIRASSTRPSRW